MKGRLISHYKIVDELGAGGMGVVYRAEDVKLGRAVALKFISPQTPENAEEKARFLREAQAAAALSHPNICVVHEIDEADGRLFMAMELVEGESLKDRISRGPLPIEEALDVALQAAGGLDAAHRKGVVHRDIKPANVMIEDGGLVKIMDFGLAKLSGKTVLTKAGTTLGTVAYMSPEQARGKEADRRSDIWSLGAVLYEMVTGRLPFRADYEQAVLYAIMNEAPAPLTALRAGVPMELERITGKALAKDPSERYQHADELAADLKRLKKSLEGTDTPRPPAAPPETAIKHPKRRIARVLVPICVAAAAVAAFVLLRPAIFGGAVATERHPVAVITFENQTGDPQYDHLKKVIPNLLITSLEQSKYLQVVTWERLRDLAKQAGRENVEEIDADLGFELCRREKIDALVIGSFMKLGDRFVTDIKVLDVASKGSLAVANADGRGLESIPEQVDRLSREISRGVGLSERKIEETQRPVIDVTTSSTEAYSYYLRGTDALERYYLEEGIKALTRAIEIDSTFAIAHLFLGLAQSRAWNRAEAINCYRGARRHAAKATERERLYIEAIYAKSLDDGDGAIRIFRELLEKYPREKLAWNLLGDQYRLSKMNREAVECQRRALELDPTFGIALNLLAYSHLAMGSYEKAVEIFRRYSALNPGDANPYDSMGEAYFNMGDLDEALRMYAKAHSLKSQMGSAVMLAYLCGIRGEYREAIRWIEENLRTQKLPGLLAGNYLWRSSSLSFLGRRERALRDPRRGFELADSIGSPGLARSSRDVEAALLFDWGRLDEAREALRAGPAAGGIPREEAGALDDYREYFMGIIDVAAGDLAAARKALGALEAGLSRIRERTSSRYLRTANWAALLEAELLLAEGQANDAIRCIEKRYRAYVPSAGPPLFYLNVPFEQDVLPRACAAMGDLDRAIAEYEKLIAFDPASKDRRLLHPRYEYRLAKLLEKRGARAKALEHYERFLEYNKDADPGIPEVIDAEARAAALRSSGT